MKKKIGLIVVLLILAVIFNIFVPTMKVIATEYGTGNYKITVNADRDEKDDTNVTVKSVTVNGENWTSDKDYYKNADGSYTIIIKATAKPGYIMKFRSREGLLYQTDVNGQNYTYTINITKTNIEWEEEGENYRKNLEFFVSSEDTQKNENDGNNLPPAGEEQDGNQPEGLYENIDVSYTFKGTTGVISINDRCVGEEADKWEGKGEKVGYTDSTKKNKVQISTSFGAPKVSKITINGKDYDFTDDSDIHVLELPGANSYVITATADNSIAQDRTIIWANTDANKNAENFEPDMVLEHGSAKVIAMYDEEGKKVAGNATVDEDGMGFVVAIPGHKVVFEFVPEYGYQLTSVKANGFALEPQETINQYTFTMPDTNVHFSAEFTKIEDVVKTESESVSGGSINLGKALSGGTARLSVNDVELSEEKEVEFEEAAGDYNIENYFDLSLDNIYYKGKKDSKDVWTKKVSHLEKKATIKLKIEGEMDADDVVIVHNKDDGKEFEVIEVESFDKETNTVEFQTESFSNYAIATKNRSDDEDTDSKNTTKNDETTDKKDIKTIDSKTENTTEKTNTTVTKATTKNETKTTSTSSNPTTGDNIIMIILIFTIATIGAFVTIILNKKQNNKKH